jgi:hypothetical protein
VVVSSTITDLDAGSGTMFGPLDRQMTISPDRHMDVFRVASTLSPPSQIRLVSASGLEESHRSHRVSWRWLP